MRLVDVKVGQGGAVDRVDGVMRCRLMELGFVSGTKVRVLGRAPMGDPLRVALRGAVLTLSASDAAEVILRGEETP